MINAKTREERTISFMNTAKEKGNKEFYYLHALICSMLFWECDIAEGVDCEAGKMFNQIFDTSMICKRLDEIQGMTGGSIGFD